MDKIKPAVTIKPLNSGPDESVREGDDDTENPESEFQYEPLVTADLFLTIAKDYVGLDTPD